MSESDIVDIIENVPAKINLITQNAGLVIKDKSSYIKTSALLQDLHSVSKELKTGINEIKKPLKDKLDRIDYISKEAIKTVDKAKAKTKELLINYIDSHTTPVNVNQSGISLINNNVPKIKGISTSRKYNYDVVDITKVPTQFLCVNDKLIKEHLKKHGDLIPIDGIKFTRSTSIMVRERE